MLIDSLIPGEKNKQQLPSYRNILTVCGQIRQKFSSLAIRPGVHTSSYMVAAGFKYTGDRDTARCNNCGLEVSNWTLDMNPFTIHSEQSPHCSFIRSIMTFSLSNLPSSTFLSTTAVRNTSTLNGKENPSKRQKIETTDFESQTNTSIEADLIHQIRKRTFSYWPHPTTPSREQMIKAGFFNCNVGDRVICIDCNLAYHQWTSHVDNPCEVHKTLSPNCKYVKEKLINREPPPIINPNESSMRVTTNNHSLQFSEFLRPTAQNNGNRGVRKPVTVSSTTSNGKKRSITDMILGRLFNTDSKAVEACSYCSKSLQNLDLVYDPTIKHAQWLLHCAHTEQEDDDELYHKTEESKQVKQERRKGNELKQTTSSGVTFNNNSTRNSRQLSLRDKRIVSRLIAAGFNLPISQRLISQNLRLSITNQNLLSLLQIKHDDSILDIDLLITCAILQKQIDHIDGKMENIVIPIEKMNQINEQNKKEQAEILARKQAATRSTASNALNNTNNEVQSSNPTLLNPCVLCLTEEKRLACIPCGHLTTCVPCGQSLRSCPICRRDVNALVQIYA